MSLTGWPLMLLTIFLVVGAPVGTYLLWNKVRGPRPMKVAARLGMIGACQFTAILLSGLVINNHYMFYASWDDVLGRTGGPGVIVHGGPSADVLGRPGEVGTAGTLGGTVSGTVGGGRGTDAGVRPVGLSQHFQDDGDGILSTTFKGPTTGLGGANDVYVWLPPQYNDPAYARTDFPVIMLFPGFPGTPNTWFGNMAGQKALGDIIAAKQSVTPFVLVAVNITPEKGVNTNCTNIPGGPQVATYLTEEVRPMIERSFRVSIVRTGWGMMGYSEGGLCSGKLLVQYPQYFSAAVQMSGDIRPDGVVARYGVDVVNQNSTLWILQNRPPTLPIALLAAASKEDGSTLQDAFTLQRAAPTVVDVLRKDKGAHNTGVWKSWLPEAYTWLTQKLDAADPNS